MPPIIHPDISIDWLRSHATGKGVRVAVIDSGIDATHPDFGDSVHGGCRIFKGEDGQTQVEEVAAGTVNDTFGHGTAVAGIIHDLAPDAEIVDVKVLDAFNTCTGDILIAGAKWALDHGFRVINMSLATAKRQWFQPLFEVCEQAYIQNSILVVSKKNFGHMGCPAMFSSVISVDREDYMDKFQVHYRPHNIIEYDARGTQVQTLAPGGGYVEQTGTSFATPHVSGLVSLLLEQFPEMNPVEAKAVLKSLSQGRAP